MSAERIRAETLPTSHPKRQWLFGSLWNFLGIGIPFLVAVVCMPLLLDGLGPVRYGLLLLAWSVVGYFSVFDFGLGRALTQRLALVDPRNQELRLAVLGTGLVALAVLGVAGGVAVAFSASVVVQWGSVPAPMNDEVIRAVLILGCGLPFVLLSTGLRGALEGFLDFGWMNVIRGLSGLGTYLAPVLVMAFSPRIDAICGGLVVMRVLSCLAYAGRCLVHVPMRASAFGVDAEAARDLASYGGWITVSNLVSPLMAYFDRFFVAGAISVALAGYYGTSQEIVTRFQVIPVAVFAALFPTIAGVHVTDPDRAGGLVVRGMRLVAWALLPVAAACLLFTREGLSVWFGPDFASGASDAARILVIGSFLNSMALGPFTFLQAVGRPDVTARIHLMELPVYLAALWLLSSRSGLSGVAFAWSGRMLVDLLVLSWAARRQSVLIAPYIGQSIRGTAAPIGLLLLSLAVTPLPARVLLILVISCMTGWVLWTEWRDDAPNRAAVKG